MISSIFIILASIFNAVMDSIEYETAFQKSIFNKLDPKWWCKSISWEYVEFLPFTNYRLDAWHLFKSLMIVSLVLSIVFYKSMYGPIVDFIILGSIWNLSFNLFYGHIFRKN